MWTGQDPAATIVRPYDAFDKRVTLGFIVPGQGRLILLLTIKGTQDNAVKNDHFSQDVRVKWRIAADADGKLTIEREGNAEIDPPDGSTDYTLDSVNPDEKATYVSVSPVIVGTSDSSSSDHSTSINIGPVGSHTEGGGSSRSKAAPRVQTTIVIDLNPIVPKKPPPPEPKGTVTILPGTEVLVKFDHEVGPFKVGKVELEGGSVTKRVYEIFYALPEATQTALIQGKLAGSVWGDGAPTNEGELIEVHGYTSNTDSQDHNFELSKKRSEVVLAAFKSLGVPATAFTQPIPHGEWSTSDDKGMAPTDEKGKEKESAQWRKVVLKIKHTQG